MKHNINNIQNTYIPSIEGSKIYSHMNRGEDIKIEYIGMIPYSLELRKLYQEGMSKRKDKTSGKWLSDDVINVKFNQKVNSSAEILNDRKKIDNKIDNVQAEIRKLEQKDTKNKEKKIENKKQYIQKLNDFIKTAQEEEWQSVKTDTLREILYADGFTIVDDKGREQRYVAYKRSSSKSRSGQCLFIKEHLYHEMINWSRMYLPLQEDMEIDYPSLMAYESLVGSSIEDTITINPKNILIVKDYESTFNQMAHSVQTENGNLEAKYQNTEIENSLFDGESLLEGEIYFPEGKSMKLLRNHMFKSAAFSTNIQQFLKDNCPSGIAFDDWYIQDMFNNSVKATDVHMITTPSSVKSLKFSDVIGSQVEMWRYWRDIVYKEGCIFGIVKTEKPSQRGYDGENILQQTSYQMLNCLPMDKDDIGKLTKFEEGYIYDLKNDDEAFVKHIQATSNDMKSNQMFADLYYRNIDIVHTQSFKDFRKSVINNYVTHIKKGKVRLHGDYTVMVGNPIELLFHAIGQFDGSAIALQDNEIYTPLFPVDKELTGFRNPNTSPSNVPVFVNTQNDYIDTYMNLTNNIAVVNAINFAIQDILSGCDYDSDVVALFDSERLLEVAKECSGYPVSVNQVGADPAEYVLNKANMASIDNTLSSSQDHIGKVVNIGQELLSLYWDMKKKNTASDDLQNEILRKIEVMTILSEISIDMAKKLYNIYIPTEINRARKFLQKNGKKKKVEQKNGKKNSKQKQDDKEKKYINILAKPKFFQYVSKSDSVGKKVMKFDCPMDMLQGQMKGLGYAKGKEYISLSSLLHKEDLKKADSKQKRKILSYVEQMNKDIKGIYASCDGSESSRKESERKVNDKMRYFEFFIEKLNVKPDTMYAILKDAEKQTKMMNILYRTQDTFIEAFKPKSQN